jgi:membrane protein DedA with SNARE-associated domain
MPGGLNVNDLVVSGGYWAVLVVVALDSICVPVPSIGVLIAAALFAGTTHRLEIGWVIAAGAGGAVAGYGVSYLAGYHAGHRLVIRHGHHIGLSQRRLRFGRYVLARFGGRILVIARFMPLLHTYAGLVVGSLRMPWHRFLVFNLLGGVIWAGGYGLAAYLMGGVIDRVSGPAGLVIAVAGAGALIGFLWFLSRSASNLEMEAERVPNQGRLV